MRMSEFKGTPFPWRYEEYEDAASYKSVRVIGSNGQTVCDSESYYPAPVEPEDAKLIAAAPELLECLIELRQWISQEIAHPNSPCGRADTAIAKALGDEK